MKRKIPLFLFASCLIFLAACSSPTQSIASDPAPTVIAASQTPVPSNSQDGSSPTPEADSFQAGAPAFSAPVSAQGEILLLSGRLLDQSGSPISSAQVEAWQTDATGIYDHPGDPNTSSRDPGFQFFGISTTDATGAWSFRTILPGRYEPRPPHIHFKVKFDGQTLLTSQFYFGQNDHPDLLVSVAQDDAGHWVGTFDVVVDSGSGGDLRLTPAQQEGPYYPVVDFSAYDNDLANPD